VKLIALDVRLDVLRKSTDPGGFPRPLAADAAIAKLGTWLSLEDVRLLREQATDCEVLRSLASETGTAGKLTTDARLAALATGHAAILVSCDSGFARLKGLRCENPQS